MRSNRMVLILGAIHGASSVGSAAPNTRLEATTAPPMVTDAARSASPAPEHPGATGGGDPERKRGGGSRQRDVVIAERRRRGHQRAERNPDHGPQDQHRPRRDAAPPRVRRRHRVCQPGTGQQCDAGIERQDVMRQLGRDRLEYQPAGDHPGDREDDRPLAPAAPHPGQRQQGEQRSGPERHREHREIGPGQRAVRFLAAGDLGRHVGTDRLGKERAVARDRDRNQPGRRDRDRQQNTRPRAQPAEPGDAPVMQRQDDPPSGRSRAG